MGVEEGLPTAGALNEQAQIIDQKIKNQPGGLRLRPLIDRYPSLETILQAVVDGPRVVMVFSPEDLTAGMLGAAVYRLKGYAPETAVSLMTNILCNLADVKP